MRRLVLSVLLLALSSTTAAQQSLAGSRPNILFVFSDDHACQAISAYGSRLNQTPNLDRIASTGALFTANFCGNAICGPSRATILTGLHSHANGFCRNGNVFDGGQTTFPKLLRQVGYQTAIVGKWHLDSPPTGFDHWMVLPDQGEYYNPDFLTQDGRVRIAGHVTDVTTDLALQWLERRDPERPFLLMCQHKAPHRNWLPAPSELGLHRDADLPEPATLFDDHRGRIGARAVTEMEIARHMTLHYDLMVPPPGGQRDALQGLDRAWIAQRERMDESQRATWDAAFAAEDEAFVRENPQGQERVRWFYQRYLKNYLRCVAGVDRSVGTLLGWLDAHPDVKANTLVVYASDQGFFLGEHGFYDKRWMDEECLRMPLLMSWPGHVDAGRQIAQLTQNIDFAPTFLELAGAPLPAGLHGTSLVPLLEGKQVAWRDAIYYHYYESQATHMVPAMYGVRTERYKLVRYYEPQWNRCELFDLQQDPDELRDVADDPAHATVRTELEKRLVQLRTQYGDDTGELASDTFPSSAGVTRVRRDGAGHAVWANAQQGYLLRVQEHTGTVTFTTTLRSLRARPLRNGYVVLAGDASRGPHVRAGIDFDARKLVLTGLPGTPARRDTTIAWDGTSQVELRLTVDLDAHTIVAEAAGVRAEGALPAGWTKLSAVGFGGSNTETWFGDLQTR